MLEDYRNALKELHASGTPLRESMRIASLAYPHELCAPTAPLIEIRNPMIRKYGAGDVFREAYRELRAELESGKHADLHITIGAPGSGKSTWAQAQKTRLVFDSAATTRRARSALLSMAAEYGVPVVGCVFLTPLEICLECNLERKPGKAVPANKVAESWRNLMREPPRKEEGFHKLLWFSR